MRVISEYWSCMRYVKSVLELQSICYIDILVCLIALSLEVYMEAVNMKIIFP